jgi:hypothetical protein
MTPITAPGRVLDATIFKGFIVVECYVLRKRRDTPAITPTQLFHGSV